MVEECTGCEGTGIVRDTILLRLVVCECMKPVVNGGVLQEPHSEFVAN